jgi:hypothetical protein
MEERVQLYDSADLPPRKMTSERNKSDTGGASRTRQFEMEKTLLLLLGIKQRYISYPVWDLTHSTDYAIQVSVTKVCNKPYLCHMREMNLSRAGVNWSS